MSSLHHWSGAMRCADSKSQLDCPARDSFCRRATFKLTAVHTKDSWAVSGRAVRRCACLCSWCTSRTQLCTTLCPTFAPAYFAL